MIRLVRFCLLGVPYFAGFKYVFLGNAKVFKRGWLKVPVRNLNLAMPMNLTPRLSRIIFISETAFGHCFDFKAPRPLRAFCCGGECVYSTKAGDMGRNYNGWWNNLFHQPSRWAQGWTAAPKTIRGGSR